MRIRDQKRTLDANDIVQEAIEHLEQRTNLKAKWIPILHDKNNAHDGKVGIVVDGKKEVLFVQVKKEFRYHHIPALAKQARQHKPLMLIAHKIFPTVKEELRKLNIAYLDGAGNIYLKTPRSLVWIDGQKQNAAIKEPVNRAFTKTGLKVVFHFLIQGDLLNATYRQIAQTTDIALGNVNYVIQGLKKHGFINNLDDKRLMLVNKAGLLDRWVTAYGERLKPTLYMGKFRFVSPEDAQHWKDIPINIKHTLWGGEPAADVLTHFLKPQIWTIYTAETKVDLIKNYHLLPDPQGNIQVYKQFWTNIAGTDKLAAVHPLLVYADLINTGDPRNIETAKKIAHQYLNI